VKSNRILELRDDHSNPNWISTFGREKQRGVTLSREKREWKGGETTGGPGKTGEKGRSLPEAYLTSWEMGFGETSEGTKKTKNNLDQRGLGGESPGGDEHAKREVADRESRYPMDTSVTGGDRDRPYEAKKKVWHDG